MNAGTNGAHVLAGVSRLSWKSGLVLAVVALALGVSPRPAATQSLTSDALASHLLGEWRGTGIYDGNELALTRSWTLELGGAFLQAEMGVSMPNGATFGAVTYWKPTGPGEYEVVWLDGMGRMQTLHMVRDPDSGLVSSDYVDELAEGGPEDRRWEYEPMGADAYVERLFRRAGDEWELLTEWAFSRVEGG